MAKFGTGLLTEPFDWTGYGDVSKLLGVSFSDVPESHHEMIEYGKYLENQQHTQSCTGFGTAQAIWVRQGSLGILEADRIYPSPLAHYYLGRAKRGGLGSKPVDIGARASDVWEATREIGIIPHDVWPTNLSKVDEQPDFRSFHKGSGKRWLEYYTIYAWGIGEARERKIKQAVSTMHPGVLGMPVDEAFMEWVGPDPYPGLVGPLLGRHLVCFVAYEPAGLWIINSWGDWGQGGLGLLSWDFVNSSEVSSIIVPEYVP